MGMDVYGRNSTTESGEYFRANCWSWRPIHELMLQHADDLFSERTMTLMGSNDGAGLCCQEECNMVADRLEEAMKDMDWKTNEHGEYYEPWPECSPVTKEGRFMNDDGTVNIYNPDTKETEKEVYSGNMRSAYCVYREHLEEFITFLRGCGGFQVW